MPDWRYYDPSLLGLKDKNTPHARAGLRGPLPALAMAADPVLHEVIRNEIRWWVTRQSDLPETGCVSLQKRGKHGRLLFSQLWGWDGEQGDWGRGYGQPRSPMVPKDLTAMIEAALKEEFAAKPQPASTADLCLVVRWFTDSPAHPSPDARGHRSERQRSHELPGLPLDGADRGPPPCSLSAGVRLPGLITDGWSGWRKQAALVLCWPAARR